MNDLPVAHRFMDLLDQNGYNFFTGVPCSYFAAVMHLLYSTPRYGYIGAVREDSAIGIAAGAWLGGRQPVIFMQNSGFALALNALTSLNQTYHIPALLVISWRGRDGQDAPEHYIMGRTLESLLKLFDIPYEVAESNCLAGQVRLLTERLCSTMRPVALVVPAGVLS